MIRHKKTVHVEEKDMPYQCQTCGKRFPYRAERSYRDHCKTHTGERDHVCEICGSSYFSKKGLRKHERAAHPALKPMKPKPFKINQPNEDRKPLNQTLNTKLSRSMSRDDSFARDETSRSRDVSFPRDRADDSLDNQTLYHNGVHHGSDHRGQLGLGHDREQHSNDRDVAQHSNDRDVAQLNNDRDVAQLNNDRDVAQHSNDRDLAQLSSMSMYAAALAQQRSHDQRMTLFNPLRNLN